MVYGPGVHVLYTSPRNFLVRTSKIVLVSTGFLSLFEPCVAKTFKTAMRLQQCLRLKRLFRIIVTFSSIYTCGASANNFPSIEFPPRLDISEADDVSPTFPMGHLKPLGHQRPADGPVKEYVDVLRPESFWEEHVSKGIPLVFRQGIGHSPALSLWTDDYLRENYGDLDVLIELKEENRTHSARRMSIKKFLSSYKQEDVYIVSVLPDPMRREVQVTNCREY